MNFSINMRQRLKGCTHRATEGLRWLSMSRYRCIERPRVSGSVGTLLCCDSGHSSKWISMEKVYLLGRQLKLKRSLENEFRSTTLGTTFSLLFCLANNPNNAMLKVLHCIPCSFWTISA